MDCKFIQKNIEAYFDNELSCDMLTKIDTHLESCDECRKIYKAEERVRKAMGVLAQTQAPDSLRSSVFDAVDAIEEEKNEEMYAENNVVRPDFRYKKWCLAAACIMLLVVVRAGVQMDTKPVVSQQDAAAYYELQENMRMINEETETLDDATVEETALDAATPEAESSTTQESREALPNETQTNQKAKEAYAETQNERIAARSQAAGKQAENTSESTEKPTATAASSNNGTSDFSAYAGTEKTASQQIVVRNVAFRISEQDRAAVTALGIDGATEEAAEAALTGAGISFTKQETAQDKTEEYRVLNVQRVSIEAALESKRGTNPMTEKVQADIDLLTNQLEDVISRQSALNDINNTTIISIEFAQKEAE